MFMTCHVKKSINISDYGNILACGAIYSQNVVLKTFLILNDTIATWQHLVAKSELFGCLWFDPAIHVLTYDFQSSFFPTLSLSEAFYGSQEGIFFSCLPNHYWFILCWIEQKKSSRNNAKFMERIRFYGISVCIPSFKASFSIC